MQIEQKGAKKMQIRKHGAAEKIQSGTQIEMMLI